MGNETAKLNQPDTMTHLELVLIVSVQLKLYKLINPPPAPVGNFFCQIQRGHAWRAAVWTGVLGPKRNM